MLGPSSILRENEEPCHVRPLLDACIDDGECQAKLRVLALDHLAMFACQAGMPPGPIGVSEQGMRGLATAAIIANTHVSVTCFPVNFSDFLASR